MKKHRRTEIVCGPNYRKDVTMSNFGKGLQDMLWIIEGSY